MILSASATEEHRIAHAGGASLVCAAHAANFKPAYFQPEFWGEGAVSVAIGGRGSAWFIDAASGQWVLREYQRGGWAAQFSKRSYVFLGEDRVRSFREFRLLVELRGAGLPVPRPIAASYQKNSLFWYQAQILVERIPDAVTFAERLSDGDEALWGLVGKLVRRFHDHGVYHADLNCHNILVSGEQLYLIDFDKCTIKAGKHPQDTWKAQNLQRLKRSVEKQLRSQPEPGREFGSRWRNLLAGYGLNDDHQV